MSEEEKGEEFAGNELMGDLAEAWDAAVGDEDEGHQTAQVHESDEQPGSGADSTIGDGGDQPESPDAEDGLRQDQDESGQQHQVAEEDKPPVSLSAAAREEWANTPEPVRKEIAKRERDFAVGIQKYAENAKRAEAMDRTLAPYQQLFAMNGGAAQFMPGLMQTASVLQMGAPAQKAQMVADLIKQFGVDIGTLDSLLVGEAPPPEVQQQSAVQQAVQQAVAPYQQHMNQIRQQQQYAMQQEQQQVASEVQQFAQTPENEFYHDVKMEMADILDLAANRGREMSMQEAYDQACQLNPQIRQILQGRQSQQSVQQKRKAGSSIHGTLGGDGSSSAPDSMRNAIEMAWEGAGRT